MRSEERALDGFWGSFIHYLDLLKGIPKSSRHLLSEQPQGTPEFVESPAPETKQATGENSVTDAQKHPFGGFDQSQSVDQWVPTEQKVKVKTRPQTSGPDDDKDGEGSKAGDIDVHVNRNTMTSTVQQR